MAVTANGDRYQDDFLSTKIKEEDSGNIWHFNRLAQHATQPKLHSMFCSLFLKIALSVIELMWFGHSLSCDFIPLDYYL